MTIGEFAKKWAAEHPEFSGILGIEKAVARGKNGRLGTKLTIYRYVAANGVVRRQPVERASFNGVCDITGTVHLARVLKWWHTADGDFVTTDEIANGMDAVPGWTGKQHPVYRRRWRWTMLIPYKD